MVIEEFDIKKKETNIYKQIVQRSTTCPKVTKFTDIFWKPCVNYEKSCISNVISLVGMLVSSAVNRGF